MQPLFNQNAEKTNLHFQYLTGKVVLFLGGSAVGWSRLDLFDPVCSLVGEATFVLGVVLVEAIATQNKRCNFDLIYNNHIDN